MSRLTLRILTLTTIWYEMSFINRIMGVRLDRLFVGLFVGATVCLNSCSAISTLKGFSGICFPLAVLACVALLFLPDREGDKSVLTVGVLAFSVPPVFSALANPSYSNITNTISLLAVVFLAYLCARKEDPESLCKVFVSVMCVTSVFSLALWVVLNIAGIDLPLPILENVNGVHYKTIIIASQFEETYIEGNNSMGFFWESGVFASYLLLAIAVEFMLQSRVSKLRLSLLIATLLTTGSTAGILLLPLALSVGLLKRGGKVRIAISLSLLIVFIVVLVNFSSIIAELAKINPSLFSKLTDADAVTRLTRLQSPSICWDLFVQSPALGYGYGGALDVYSAYVASNSTVDSLTTTSIFQLAAFGILGFAMWLVTAWSVFATRRLPATAAFVLLVMFVIIINKEPHTASALTYMLIFAFLSFGEGLTDPISGSKHEGANEKQA